MIDGVAASLPEGIVLLDGGMGQELIRRGVNSLWSADALVTAPAVVQAVHEDYLRAGADIITTNTYAAIRERLEPEGYGERFVELNQLAGLLAQKAREAIGRDALIAGSLPPLRGSYRPDLIADFHEIEPHYREQAEVLAPYVDLFLCETMSSAEESKAAAVSTGKPVLISWTLRDDGSAVVRSGESLAEVASNVSHLPIAGYLVNCCAPESVTAAIPQLVALSTVPVGGYANGFDLIPEDWRYETPDSLPGRRRDLGPDEYAVHVSKWLSEGARVVGGCCEIGPEHIARLRELVDAA